MSAVNGVPRADDDFCLLPGRTVGRWAVTTESSSYELDFDRMTVTRVPSTDADGSAAASLRRDASPVPLLDAAPVTVGKPMSLLLDVRGDGVQTLRRSTPVVRIAGLPVAAATAMGSVPGGGS